jgi:hypothetical protein
MPAPAPRRRPAAPRASSADAKAEHEILFQKFFKSVGPRTYASQIKRANNGNHYLVLTEGKRDEKTDEVRKVRLYLFSEDFVAFFRMLHETAQFIRANPVPAEVRKKRERYWAKQEANAPPAERDASPAARRGPARPTPTRAVPARPARPPAERGVIVAQRAEPIGRQASVGDRAKTVAPAFAGRVAARPGSEARTRKAPDGARPQRRGSW